MASLSLANERSIACFSNEKQLPFLETTKAAAIITTPLLAKYCKVPTISVLCVPSIAERLLSIFDKDYLRLVSDLTGPTIHETAVIEDNAVIGKQVAIGPNVVIESCVQVGNGCVIGANTVLSKSAILEDGVVLAAGVKVLQDCIIGANSTIDAGCVIGATPYNPVKKKGKWHLPAPKGRVIIGECTKIGANTVIDRGVFGDTYIANNCVIDNLVQIAHDVIISENTAIAASAIIGANTLIEAHCTIGGGCSIAGQLTIVAETVLTGRTTVSRSLLKAGIYSSGVTAQPHDKWRRNVARFHRLDASIKELKRLKNIVESTVNE